MENFKEYRRKILYINQEIGKFGEDIATKYLQKKGYKIIERNFSCKQGEIDIIAKKHNTIIFVEVKARKTVSAAWDAITPAQSVRLRRAAETYLINKHWDGDARFDVIVVCGHKIYWAKNAI